MKLSNPLKQRPGEDKYSNERIWRFLVVIAVLGVIGVVANGGATFFAKVDSNNKTNAIVQARTESRITQCHRDNVTRHDAIEAAKNKARDLIKAAHANPDAPDSVAYVQSQGEATAAAYPRRDCSNAGIAAFYKNPPPEPDDGPCVGDGKGLCK